MPSPPRPAPRARVLITVAAIGILIASLGLFGYELRTPRLMLDDFAYLAESRGFDRLAAYAFQPHNSHVVPLFRALTGFLLALAGTLSPVPRIFCESAWLGLALLAMATGRLVAIESGSTLRGLVAMAALAVNSVMQPLATWWSGSQVTWCGLMIVLALLAVNQYIAKSRRLWLVATIAAIIAAPLFWSGGLVAGFVAGVRLLTDRGTDRPSLRRAGRACLLLSLGLAVFIAFLVSRHGFPGAELRGSILRYPANAVVNSARAGMEGLLLGNLGIDAPLPLPATASVAVILLAVSLAAFRLRKPLLSPLGWAALTLIVSSYLLIYLFRGNLGWEALRPIVWYHGLAQVGLVLLLTGGLAARHKGRASLSRLDVLILTMVVLGLLRIHSTRVAEHVGDLRSIDRLISAPEAVQRLLRNERAFLQIYQEHSLAALDGIEEEARDLGAGREEVRQAGGPLPFPGWPPMLENHDPYDLLRLPPRSRGDVDIGRLRASMSQYAQYIRDQSAQAR